MVLDHYDECRKKAIYIPGTLKVERTVKLKVEKKNMLREQYLNEAVSLVSLQHISPNVERDWIFNFLCTI